jgi:hypothetical protein
MTIQNQIEFQKEDYKKYSNGYDSEREHFFVFLTYQDELNKRLASS